VLLSIWASAGSHMRRYLDSFTLEDIASMARGQEGWPEA
jgi:DNA-binding IscR family transcriptional regulator